MGPIRRKFLTNNFTISSKRSTPISATKRQTMSSRRLTLTAVAPFQCNSSRPSFSTAASSYRLNSTRFLPLRSETTARRPSSASLPMPVAKLRAVFKNCTGSSLGTDSHYGRCLMILTKRREVSLLQSLPSSFEKSHRGLMTSRKRRFDAGLN